jgi:hypothetical protein
MTAGRYDIIVEQRATFYRAITITEDGSPKDLRGWSLTAEGRYLPSDAATAIAFDVVARDLQNGAIAISASITKTTPLSIADPPARTIGYWDLRGAPTAGAEQVTRFLQGQIDFDPGVSR